MKTGNYENRVNARWAAIMVCLFVFASWTGVCAAAKSPLETVLRAEKVATGDDGKESIQPMKKVAPGEIIQYRIDQKNIGDGPLKDITAIGPIPKGTKYVAKSAKTQTTSVFEVSIDNGQTWNKEPVTRKVKNAAGEMVEETVPPTEDTAAPGMVLKYVLTYTNGSAKPVSGVVVSDDTPAYTTYVDGSATVCTSAPPGGWPSGITGCSRTVPTSATNWIGTIKWTLNGSLNSNASGTLEYRVEVDQ